jgi:hypothetical protein
VRSTRGDYDNIPAINCPFTDAARFMCISYIIYFKENYGAVSGSIDLTVKKRKGIRSVVFEYTTMPSPNSTPCIICTATKGKCTIAGLTPAENVWACAAAIGPRDQVLYTLPIQKLEV